MDSSYLRTPPSSPLLATLSQVRSFGTLARASRTGGSSGVTKEEVVPPPPSVSVSGSLSSSRTQLNLLDQLVGSTSDLEGTWPILFLRARQDEFPVIGYESESNPDWPTIQEQLERLVRDREGNFSIPLGKNLKKVSEKFLTVSQKRNIRRQAYLDEVSQRNDSVFFATIGAFIILPPFVILGIAILTDYVQLCP